MNKRLPNLRVKLRVLIYSPVEYHVTSGWANTTLVRTMIQDTKEITYTISLLKTDEKLAVTVIIT